LQIQRLQRLDLLLHSRQSLYQDSIRGTLVQIGLDSTKQPSCRLHLTFAFLNSSPMVAAHTLHCFAISLQSLQLSVRFIKFDIERAGFADKLRFALLLLLGVFACELRLSKHINGRLQYQLRPGAHLFSACQPGLLFTLLLSDSSDKCVITFECHRPHGMGKAF